MKVAVFINECPIQQALVCKMINNINVDIDIVFKSKNLLDKKKGSFYFFKRLLRVPFELPFRFAWEKLKKFYKNQYPELPKNIDIKIVNNINDKLVINYIKQSKPSLIIVSATTMVKNEIINEAKKINCLILNLHTGVSPYIKGGPNCTNWCLSKNYYLIGNTVMKLDEGIDSGAIITTEITNLDGTENLFQLHYKVMEHGFKLYIKVIKCLVENKGKVNAIPQEKISTQGELFYTKDWTISKAIKAYYNFILYYKKGIQNFSPINNKIKTIPFICETNDEK
jgi:folate-dependent phosphoribosylglycinamide formyltransferase PurN